MDSPKTTHVWAACNQSHSIMPLSFISSERFDWKPWTISCSACGDTLLYDIQSLLWGLLQSGEWTHIKLVSTLPVVNVLYAILSQLASHTPSHSVFDVLDCFSVCPQLHLCMFKCCDAQTPDAYKHTETLKEKIWFICYVQTNKHQQTWDDK